MLIIKEDVVTLICGYVCFAEGDKFGRKAFCTIS